MSAVAFEVRPDGKELRAQISCANPGQIHVTGSGVGGQVEPFIDEALRRVGVAVDDDG
jgi:hypothetical protein